MAENPKTAEGQKKPQLALVPPAANEACAAAFADGARKYGAYNWRKTGVPYMTYVHAAKRHLDAMLDGEDTDPDSGTLHAGHVMACMAILVDAAACGKLEDDRPPARNPPDKPAFEIVGPPDLYQTVPPDRYLYELRTTAAGREYRVVAFDGCELPTPGVWYAVLPGHEFVSYR